MVINNKIAEKNRTDNLRILDRYCVFIQENQEQSLKKLSNLHDESEKKENDLKILINSFVKDNKKDKKITSLSYIENLLESLNQVEYCFSEFLEAERHFQSTLVDNDRDYFLKKKTASVLVFFYNAFSFMKIVENHTTIRKDTNFNQFLTDITSIRDHFAHSYKKDVYAGSSSKAFVNFQIQAGGGLESLVLTNLATGLAVGRLWFSLPTFYFSLRNIFKELKDNPKLFIKQGNFNNN